MQTLGVDKREQGSYHSVLHGESQPIQPNPIEVSEMTLAKFALAHSIMGGEAKEGGSIVRFQKGGNVKEALLFIQSDYHTWGKNKCYQVWSHVEDVGADNDEPEYIRYQFIVNPTNSRVLVNKFSVVSPISINRNGGSTEYVECDPTNIYELFHLNPVCADARDEEVMKRWQEMYYSEGRNSRSLETTNDSILAMNYLSEFVSEAYGHKFEEWRRVPNNMVMYTDSGLIDFAELDHSVALPELV